MVINIKLISVITYHCFKTTLNTVKKKKKIIPHGHLKLISEGKYPLICKVCYVSYIFYKDNIFIVVNIKNYWKMNVLCHAIYQIIICFYIYLNYLKNI